MAIMTGVTGSKAPLTPHGGLIIALLLGYFAKLEI
jgi:hypothetical protein